MDVDVHIIKLGLNLFLHWHPCINQLSPVHRPVRVAHLNFCSCTAFRLVVYLVRSKHCSLSALCRKLPMYRGHQQFPWTQHPYAFLIVHVCWLHPRGCFLQHIHYTFIQQNMYRLYWQSVYCRGKWRIIFLLYW